MFLPPPGLTISFLRRCGAITPPHCASGLCRQRTSNTTAITGTSAISPNGRSRRNEIAAASCMAQHFSAPPFAAGEQRQPQCQREDQRGAERPLEQRQIRTPRQGLQFRRREAIDIRVDRLQLRTILGAEEVSPGGLCDSSQGAEVDAVLTGGCGI